MDLLRKLFLSTSVFLVMVVLVLLNSRNFDGWGTMIGSFALGWVTAPFLVKIWDKK